MVWLLRPSWSTTKISRCSTRSNNSRHDAIWSRNFFRSRLTQTRQVIWMKSSSNGGLSFSRCRTKTCQAGKTSSVARSSTELVWMGRKIASKFWLWSRTEKPTWRLLTTWSMRLSCTTLFQSKPRALSRRPTSATPGRSYLPWWLSIAYSWSATKVTWRTNKLNFRAFLPAES